MILLVLSIIFLVGCYISSVMVILGVVGSMFAKNFPVPGMEGVSAMACILVPLLFVQLTKRSKELPRLIHSNYHIGLTLAFAYVIVTSACLNSPFYPESMSNGFKFAGPLIWTNLFLFFIRTYDELILSAKMYCAIALVLCLDIISGRIIGVDFLDLDLSGVRPGGIFGNANGLAGAVCTAIFFVIYLSSHLGGKMRALFLLVLLSCLSAVLMITASRAATVGLVMGLVLFLYMYNKGLPDRSGKRMLRTMVVAAMIVTSSAGILYLLVERNLFCYNRFGLTALIHSSGSAQRRLNTIAGLETFLDNPLFGIGVGNFRGEIVNKVDALSYIFSSEDFRQQLNEVSHSPIATLLAELGMSGFAILSLMVFLSYKELSRIITSPVPTKDQKTFAAIIAGIELATLVHASFRGGGERWFMAWWIIGLPYVLGDALRSHRVGRRKTVGATKQVFQRNRIKVLVKP